MSLESSARDELAQEYFDRLPYEPYPVQEEALLAWFTQAQGVMVCAPTGTGKTLIAEAALFEALKTGRRAYYTTPLIALTEQKFDEMLHRVREWGFDPGDVGLVTGNRRVNPEARILIVVAEILLNRLLHREVFDFSDVGAVVMDEFHSFNDAERGVVWELTLGLLPAHVRTLLLSATVGNAVEFSSWLRRAHNRRVELVQSEDRKVPLKYEWVGDRLLDELLTEMASGDDATRRTPALVFCFNREECWSVAEQLKGKALVDKSRRKELLDELAQFDWSQGAGAKLKQILQRGVGVHHAGVLPKYRRIVEDLFQRKLLSVCVCTETLSAGINLPARSVVVPSLMKGPPDKKKLIEPSSAHQIFGRAGRPQYDDCGYVFALAHEDDVKILRWQQQYDQIPEGTKDPGLLKAKKNLKRKKPQRRSNQQYWNQQQFEKLIAAPPGRLQSKGNLPWRLLAHMIDASPEIEPIRQLVGKRLMDSKRLERAQKDLDQMLMTLWRAGYVELEPPPPRTSGDGQPGDSAGNAAGALPGDPADQSASGSADESTHQGGNPAADRPAAGGDGSPDDGGQDGGDAGDASSETKELTAADLTLGFSDSLLESDDRSRGGQPLKETKKTENGTEEKAAGDGDAPPPYRPEKAHPTETLPRLAVFRSVHPLYGVFLVNQLGIANREERIQAMESVLEFPGSVARLVRVPPQDQLPPGPLATQRLDVNLLQLGLATEEELVGTKEDERDRNRERGRWEERKYVYTLAEKLRLQFDFDFPGVRDLRTVPVWAAGAVLEHGGDFNRFVTNNKLHKQEGIVFRHILRMILLLGEFLQLNPADTDPDEWQGDLRDISDRLTHACRAIDPTSTEKVLEQIQVTAQLAQEGDVPI